MKKIYLIKAADLRVKNPTSFVDEVFTNKKLAEAYVKFWNNNPEHSYQYWIKEMEICKADYTFINKVDI